MIRFGRLLLLASTLVGTLTISAFALPSHVLACSCVQMEDGRFFTGKEDVVVTGTVGPHQGNGVYAFAVDRWFRGGTDPVIPMVSGIQPLPGGGQAMNTCGLDLHPGQQWILAAYKSDGGSSYSPGACSANAQLGSDYANEMIAAAVAVFGPGAAPGPGGQEAEPPTPVDAPIAQGFDPVQLAIVIVTPFVAIVLILAVVAVFRRREGGTEAS